MKIKLASVALLAGAAVLCSSCVLPMDGMGTFSYSTDGYNTSVAWTNASYDSSGFPIYGYSYGRPVYGYTASGVAIFTLAALTAACYVPHWGPAPWYHGTWHYPAHIHRAPAPPRFPSGHMPAHRPIGGLHAPIHHNPGSVMGPPRGPAHNPAPANHRPILGGNNHQPNKPGNFNPAPGNNRPILGGNNKPGNNKPGLNNNNKPGSNKPGLNNNNKPGSNKPGLNNNNKPGSNKPGLNNNNKPGNNRPILGGNKPGNNNPPGNRGGDVSRPAGRSTNSHTVTPNFGSRPSSGGGSGFSSRPSSGGGSGFSSRPSGGGSRPSGGGGMRPPAGGRR